MDGKLATALTQCPECDEPLLIPVRPRQLGLTEYVLHFDLSQVREHVDSHSPLIAAEPPPTGR